GAPNGTPGTLRLTQDVSLDNFNNDAALFLVDGNGRIAIDKTGPALLTVDTEQGNSAGVTDVAGINWADVASLSAAAAAAGQDLTLDVSNVGAGSNAGNVTLGRVDNALGA